MGIISDFNTIKGLVLAGGLAFGAYTTGLSACLTEGPHSMNCSNVIRGFQATLTQTGNEIVNWGIATSHDTVQDMKKDIPQDARNAFKRPNQF